LYATTSFAGLKSEILEQLAANHVKVDFGKIHGQRVFDNYIASVTNFTARLPPFDFVLHDKRQYLRVKSDDIQFARFKRNPKADRRVAIIPTCEPRIKLIVIPLMLVETELNQGMARAASEVIANLEIMRKTERVCLLIPSFSLRTEFEIPDLTGVMLNTDSRIATAHMAVKMNLVHGRY
jgi:hypothetical protein